MTMYEWTFFILLYLALIGYTIHLTREIGRKVKL